MRHITENTSIIATYTDKQPTQDISIAEGISFEYLILLEDDADIDFNIYCHGEKSQANIKILCLGKHNHRVASNVITSLDANQSQANVYMLSLLPNGSDINIHGNIILSPNVAKVSGHLLEENIILGNKIKIRTAPILDVRSSDVSASHGCRVERLDPKRLFYMQSRWLTQSQSQALILDGYINTLFEWFEDPTQIKDTIKEKIAQLSL